jgi:hypothetical protein
MNSDLTFRWTSWATVADRAHVHSGCAAPARAVARHDSVRHLAGYHSGKASCSIQLPDTGVQVFTQYFHGSSHDSFFTSSRWSYISSFRFRPPDPLHLTSSTMFRSFAGETRRLVEVIPGLPPVLPSKWSHKGGSTDTQSTLGRTRSNPPPYTAVKLCDSQNSLLACSGSITNFYIHFRQTNFPFREK